MPRAPVDMAVRRKMRKGTHSCFECRRRKIKCVFSSDSPSICTECFARGSKCIDQEHADSDIIVDQRKNLRERVARLETVIETLLQEKSERGAAEALQGLGSHPLPHTPLSYDTAPALEIHGSAPLMSMFDNVVLSRADSAGDRDSDSCGDHGGNTLVGSPNTAGDNGDRLSNFGAAFSQGSSARSKAFTDNPATTTKHQRTRKALLSVLPSHDEMMQILRTNSEWWVMWRCKTPGLTKVVETLDQFASRVLSNGVPGELGTLAICVGICLEGDAIDRYLAIVDRWIISDDEYAGTLEGMECTLLQAKCYADIGQPRRAWLCFRRGLTFAQLMGLHRVRTSDPARESIWWSFYQGDRFISLLLGLPYGIADVTCDLSISEKNAGKPGFPNIFASKLAILAGQVIDRTQSKQMPSWSSALDLEQALDEIGKVMPTEWWDMPNYATPDGPCQNMAVLRETIMGQICFYQIRVYLHLPFMLKSATNQRYEYSRKACLDAAREMLRLYHLLRGGNGQPLYECKAIDFLGFTASILVLLGLLGYGKLAPSQDPETEENDWRLIEISMDIFRRAASEKGGMVARQSYDVLKQLSCVRNADISATPEDCVAKVVIPYFGTISLRRGKSFDPRSNCSPSTSAQNTPPSAADNSSVQMNDFLSQSADANGVCNDQFIAYDGMYLSTESFDPQIMTEDGLGNIPMMTGASGYAWQPAPNMDIDQDWNWFLNKDIQQQQPYDNSQKQIFPIGLHIG